jgi:hypothetical protein
MIFRVPAIKNGAFIREGRANINPTNSGLMAAPVCACGYLCQEFVSNATHSSKVFGTGRFWLQFLTQLQNVVVDRAGTRIKAVSPNFIEKFIPRDQWVKFSELDSGINEPGKYWWRHEELTPLGVLGSGRLGGYRF